MSKRIQADKIIRSHVLWAIGGGLIPVPLVDFAAVTAVQLEMLQQLADLYEVQNYQKSKGKAFVSALTGTTFASIGSSFLKAIPGVGSIVGGVSMSVASGASTYGVGQVAINLFSGSGNFDNFDAAEVKQAYKEAYEAGKNYVSDLEKEKQSGSASAPTTQEDDIYEALAKLGKLKDQGILSEEEFLMKKKELLDRI